MEGLIGYPKDRDKNHRNLRTNFLQPEENDAWRFFTCFYQSFYSK
jgi:hypothetical protein